MSAPYSQPLTYYKIYDIIGLMKSTNHADAVKGTHTNKLICGDNLEVLSTLKSESVDLIYLDPPFFSNRNYEILWGDEAEIRSFVDRWEGGIEVYIAWMKERIQEMHRVLKPTGSLYLHCDWHAGHYLKVMLDEIFGRNNFRNEIVWSYKTGGASKRHFSRKHDTIFFYSKSDDYTFNPQKEKSYMMHNYGFKKSDFQIDEKGQYTWVFMKDVWDIPSIGSADKQRLHYPTQKPEALLERIIESSSNEGDVVLDAFAGCGTASAVAQKLKRRWIGIDISPSAIALTKRRLTMMDMELNQNVVKNVAIIGMPTTTDDTRNFDHFEFQYYVVNEMYGTPSEKKVGDMGIDGLTFLYHQPIQVKQSDDVGRNVIDNFETAIRRYYGGNPTNMKKGILVAYSFTKGAHEEAARVKRVENIDIELVTVKELLSTKFKTQMSPQNIQSQQQSFLQYA